MGLDHEDEIVRAAQGIVLEEDAGLSQTEPEEDFKPRSNKRNATSQGRRKIDIEFIDDKTKRHITFSKRKAGIMKKVGLNLIDFRKLQVYSKAYELATLTGTQVLLLVVSETGLVYTYTTPKLQPLVSAKRGKNLIQACLNVDDNEDPVLEDQSTYQQNGTQDLGAYSLPASPPSIQASLPTTTAPISAAYTTAQMGGPGLPAFDYPFTKSGNWAPMNYASMPEMMPATNGMSNGVPSGPSNGMALPAPQSSPTAPKTLKRRKTTENLNKGRDVSQAAQLAEAQDQAGQALETARYNTCLSTLFQAYNLHIEAQSISTPGLNGVAPTFVELQMAISAINEPSNQHYPSIQLNSSVEALLSLFDFFFSVYLPPKGLPVASQEILISDLINFAGWLLANNFIAISTHASLLRLATPPSNSAASHEIQAIVRSNSKTREDRATVMLAEYCAFGRERYRKYWDEQIEPLEGTFLVLCVSSSFILLDDCNLDAEQDYIDSTAPFKVRTASCLNALLRRGDTIQCQIKKVSGSSFWLPVTSGPLSPTREDLDPEYQPHTEIHRFEMDRCLQMDDQVGLVHASVQLQKAERADQLLEMGEFDDEGFLPGEARKKKLRRVQSSL